MCKVFDDSTHNTIHTGSDFCGNCEFCASKNGIYVCEKTAELLDPDWSSCDSFSTPIDNSYTPIDNFYTPISTPNPVKHSDSKTEFLFDTKSQIELMMRHLITLEIRVEILETREKEMTKSLDSLDDDYEECHGELCEAEAWIDALKGFVNRTYERFHNFEDRFHILEAKVFKGYDIRLDAEVCQMCDRKDDPDNCNSKCPLFPF